jgi:hypothetical protein
MEPNSFTRCFSLGVFVIVIGMVLQSRLMIGIGIGLEVLAVLILAFGCFARRGMT